MPTKEPFYAKKAQFLRYFGENEAGFHSLFYVVPVRFRAPEEFTFEGVRYLLVERRIVTPKEYVARYTLVNTIPSWWALEHDEAERLMRQLLPDSVLRRLAHFEREGAQCR